MFYFKKIACRGKYQDDCAISDLISYIVDSEKTPSNLICGVKVDMDHIADSMIDMSQKYKKYKKIRIHHFVITFESKYSSELELISRIMQDICTDIGRKFQIVAAVHEDTAHPHIHFAFNPVSFVNGFKYRGNKADYRELIDRSSEILSEYGLYPLVPVKYRPEKDGMHE